MRLYSYSSAHLTFVDAKWIITKFVMTRVLIGIVILYGVIKLDYPISNPLGSRSPSMIAAENDILRQQLSAISPRVRSLEMQARQLHERADELHTLLLQHSIVIDTVSTFTSAAKALQIRTVLPAGEEVRSHIPFVGKVQSAAHF